jgi:hypothetical protein
MKRGAAALRLVVIALMLSSLCVAGAVGTDERTSGLINGRGWSRLSPSARIFFIFGYCEGSAGFGCPLHLPYGKIAEGVSAVYRAPENLRLPIGFALVAFSLKCLGKPDAEVEKYLVGARQGLDRDAERQRAATQERKDTGEQQAK